MVKTVESDQVNDMSGGDDMTCVQCSICLDLVFYGGDRSRAKLQCGHQFHLDCIGSAFNVKGRMQCPNCRNIEHGQWLCSSGTRSSAQEFIITDTVVDFFNFVQMFYGVHICPFPGVHPSWESSDELSNTLTSMVTHQHPGSSSQAHGWIHYEHVPYHPQQLFVPPLPINFGTGRFNIPTSMPRSIPPGRVYNPNAAFCLYFDNPSLNYFHPSGRYNIPHFP